MLAARLARASSGHAPALGGRRPLLARRARLERAQEPANRARRRPARARARRARASSWRRATRSGSSATASAWTPGSSSGSSREGRLEEAVELCDGELLPGLDAEWVYEARESHRHRLGDVLERLAADAEAAGALKDAIRISRRRVELDPLREDAQRELIRRLIAAGEVAAARVAFDDLARRLRAELHVPPSRETRRLLEAIHAHAGAPASAAAERCRRCPPALARRERSPFVGREDALGWLRAQWSEARRGSGRLAVIAGEPGHRQDAAGERARPRRSRGGRGGAARPLSRGGADLLSAVRRGVRSVRRGGVARGAARPGRHATGASSRGSFPSSPGGSRILPEPAGDDSEGQRFRLFEAAGSLLANASRSWPVVLRAGGPALGGQADRPAADARRALDPDRARAGHRHLPRDGAGRAAGLRARGPAPRARASSGCGWEACTAGRSRR